jgi:anti-repressor protein
MPRDGSLPEPQLILGNGPPRVDTRNLAAVSGRRPWHVKHAVDKVLEDHPELTPCVIPGTFKHKGRICQRYEIGRPALAAVFGHLNNLPGRWDKKACFARYERLFTDAEFPYPVVAFVRWLRGEGATVELRDGVHRLCMPEERQSAVITAQVKADYLRMRDDIRAYLQTLPLDVPEPEAPEPALPNLPPDPPEEGDDVPDEDEDVEIEEPPEPEPGPEVDPAQEDLGLRGRAVVSLPFVNGAKRYPVRGAWINGEPWVVGVDVSRAMEYTNPQKAIRDHCRRYSTLEDLCGEGKVNETFTSLHPHTLMIPESDVFRLIMRSDKPQADEFQDFVCGTVLPQIRKTGRYDPNPALTIDSLVNNPDAMLSLIAGYAGANKQLRAELTVSRQETEEERAARLQAEERNAELEPKADGYDALVSAEGHINLTITAKHLGKGRNWLIGWMIDNKYLYPLTDGKGTKVPYQKWVDKGFFTVRSEVRETIEGKPYHMTQSYLTPLGLAHFKTMFGVGDDWLPHFDFDPNKKH